MTPEMETAVKYQSHLPALLACIASTSGPVLELGVGYFSTPHLHALCLAMRRDLVSIEANDEWHLEFVKYRTAYYGTGVVGSIAHTIFHGPSLEVLQKHLSLIQWGVALIDDSPGGENRGNNFRYLIDRSDFVVMHDAQKEDENFKAVEPMLAGLNWHLCTGVFPHTLIASKTREIPQVLKGM